MGTHIHVGTANRRNALALLLLALAMLFNTAVPAMAQKNMTGALKKKNLLGKGNLQGGRRRYGRQRAVSVF